MIPALNLIPWRGERRARQKRYALLQILVAGLGAVLLVAALATRLHQSEAVLMTASTQLEAAERALTARVQEVQATAARRQSLQGRLDQLAEIEQRQAAGPRLLQEVAAAVPAGVTLTRLGRTGSGIELHGLAGSHHAIAALLRNLEQAPGVMQPALVGAAADKPGDPAAFSIEAQESPAGIQRQAP